MCVLSSLVSRGFNWTLGVSLSKKSHWGQPDPSNLQACENDFMYVILSLLQFIYVVSLEQITFNVQSRGVYKKSLKQFIESLTPNCVCVLHKIEENIFAVFCGNLFSFF